MYNISFLALLVAGAAFASVILLATRLGTHAQELERRLRQFKVDSDRREETIRLSLARLMADRAALDQLIQDCRLNLGDMAQQSKEINDRVLKVEQSLARPAPAHAVRTSQERAAIPFHKRLGMGAA